MHVSPAKKVWLLDAGQSDPYVPLGFAGDTKTLQWFDGLWPYIDLI